MSQYSFGDLILTRTDPRYHNALIDAYKNKLRPRCLCKTPGLEMYIACIGDNRYTLKRLPYSGQKHRPDCESFEIPAELSGRQGVLQKAISEDQDTGLTSLKLDFTLSKITRKSAPAAGDPKEKKTVQANPTKLTLRSLLHYLYEDAGLNKWSPKMEGKRDWFIIRKYLLQAAQDKITRTNPLMQYLFIPENFSIDHKDEIVARHKDFLTTLKKQGNKQPMGILIGELKNIEKARFGYKMMVKHMPDIPVYFDDTVYKRINKVFSTELAFFNEDESTHLLTICTFILSATGSPQVDTISFMSVDHHWLAFESSDELALLEKLCNEQRHFIKGLRYNLNSDEIIASVLLTDTDDTPTALYLVPTDATENYQNDLNAIIEQSEFESEVIGVLKSTKE